jgi:MoaA/NifB/PqqE/SkfB family radical SAM enzyme
MKPIIVPKTYKYISAFLTMRCNINCSYCLNAFDKDFRRRGEEISGEEWVKGLNRIQSRPEVPITFSGGEPFVHHDFIYILNNLKPDLTIDVLTNLYPHPEKHREKLEEFLAKVNPERLKRNAPYASIRVSYHPEQMDPRLLVENVKRFQDRGFDVGIWAVLYPSSGQLSAINQMQFICKESGIDFRLKEFTGVYKGEEYGDYSKYPASTFQDETKDCLCKISDFLIAPDGNVHRCHRDLFAREFPVGNILYENFELRDVFRACDKYGQCHPCDVKVKTDHKQKLGHTSVEIKDVK